ncbi:MAG: choice-of-anchor Q domain-containing protein, partial [Fulvivirga sp.]|nr:choice-of-anchor Q domain-containing protein [Fulvivirga sp.]
MINSILWGSLNDELLLSNAGGAGFDLNILNSILKTADNELIGESNILNENPQFVAPREYNYALDTLSPAKDAGQEIGILLDLEGKSRDSQPDIGAFERIEN